MLLSLLGCATVPSAPEVPMPDPLPHFEVRLPDDRAVFQQGEPITLQLVFHSDVPDTFQLDAATYDRSGRLTTERFLITPTAPDPLADWFDQGPWSMGGLRSVPMLGPEPQIVTRDLAEHLRLEPGDYQLVVQTDRITAASGPVPLSSEPIALTVIPADPGWAAQRTHEAVQTIDTSDDEEARRAAARRLRFLGTEEAARQMAARLGRSDPGSTNFELNFGLIGSPHRALVIAELQAAIADPDRPIDTGMVQTLALLRAKERSPEPLPPWPGDPAAQPAWQEAAAASQAQRRQEQLAVAAQLAEALERKAPGARAICTETLNQLSWSHDGAPQAPDLIEVFARLDPARQRSLLDHQWLRLDGVRLLPELERLASADDTDAALRAAALRRLVELDPDRARPLFLAELQEPWPPRMGSWALDVLRSLPDEALPQLEPIWAGRLDAATGWELSLIERYGTDALADEVEALLSRQPEGWNQDTFTAGVAYLLRVRPGAGQRLLAEGLATPELRQRRASTLARIGALQPHSAVEAMAIELLADDDPHVAADAARALKLHGGPGGQAALWARLEAFHARWRDRPEALANQPLGDNPHWPEVMLEAALYDALGRARGWWLGSDGAQRVLSLVVSEHGRDQARFIAPGDPVVLTPRVAYSGARELRLGQHELDSIEALRAKLSQLPPQTTLQLSPWPHGPQPQQDALTSAAVEAAEALGHTVLSGG